MGAQKEVRRLVQQDLVARYVKQALDVNLSAAEVRWRYKKAAVLALATLLALGVLVVIQIFTPGTVGEYSWWRLILFFPVFVAFDAYRSARKKF